jgi:arylsulfatase
MVKLRWGMLPLALGVPVGLALGVAECLQSPQCRFYGHYAYLRLLTATLAQRVDWFVLILTALCAVLVLCGAAGRRYPRLQWLCWGLLPVAALVGAARLLLPPATWASMCHTLAMPATWKSIGLVVALAACVSVWVRLRRKQNSPTLASAPPSGAGNTRVPVALHAVAVWWTGVFVVLVLAVNLASAGWWCATALAGQQRPNVILIMSCSVRADHLGCYGYDLPTTPNLDRFARESTRFAHAVSPSSWTLWSTASVLTARYPERIFSSTEYVAEHIYYPGMPTTLANLGYTTHIVTSHPFMQNTDSFNYPQGFDTYEKLGDGFMDHMAPTVTQRALRHAIRRQGRPFFLYLMFADTHMPYTQHPEYVFGPSRKDDLDPQWLSSLPPGHRSLTPAQLRRLLGTTPGDRNEIGEGRQLRLAKYNSEIAYTDHAIGNFLQELKRKGQYDNSLIIFCSDHGEEFLEHGRYGHFNTLFPEVVDVPLLVKMPYQKTGKVIQGWYPLIDLFPSIMTMLHQDASRMKLHGEGVDLAALLRCTDKPIYGATIYRARSVTQSGMQYFTGASITPIGQDLFEGELHVLLERSVSHCYNLRRDPWAYHDLLPAASAQSAALAAIMRTHDAALDKLTTEASPNFAADLEAAHDKLRSLGYLQE